ncbi:MAG: PLP-dependent aminotransferase family protein [Candidatus Protistobacter heckmanni]|nr:PLP-dependent aminotransferase family protein [Candidatus Protistobacter heckmanni]
MLTLHTLDWNTAYAGRAERMRASEIRELLKLLDQPDIISFAGGTPDPALFPVQAASEAYARILSSTEGPQSLQYSVSEGYRPLREWIAAHMARLGVPCGVDNIVITSGSQQGLDFLGKLLIGPGDTALVAAPTYLGALQAFNAYEPRYDVFHVDGQGGGMRAEAHLRCAQAAQSRLALAYAVPDFANTTGETMGEVARLALLDLAAELGIPLIEDAAYAQLRFEGGPQRALQVLDVERCGHIDRSRVIYCGTFSKTVSPGMRLGWVCASQELAQKIVLTKQSGDLHTATLNQMVLEAIVRDGYAAQVERITAVYAKRRDAMLAALERHMPEGVRWTRPQGGMFV